MEVKQKRRPAPGPDAAQSKKKLTEAELEELRRKAQGAPLDPELLGLTESEAVPSESEEATLDLVFGKGVRPFGPARRKADEPAPGEPIVQAPKVLPTVQEHQKLAQSINAKLKGGGDKPAVKSPGDQ